LLTHLMTPPLSASPSPLYPPCVLPSLGGGRAKGQEGAVARAAGPSGEGIELDTAVSGSAGKRRRNDDDRNDRNSKRSTVMRVCTAGEGSGSDSGTDPEPKIWAASPVENTPWGPNQTVRSIPGGHGMEGLPPSWSLHRVMASLYRAPEFR
jgi:hypothetical protein